MDDDQAFRDLVRRVRAGDQEAAAEFVRLYEPEIRRSIRIQLRRSSLRRVFDSVDICQSVLARFFVRAAAGQLELEQRAKVRHLLLVMAQNRLKDHARKEKVEVRGVSGGADVLAGAVGPADDPGEAVAADELLRLLHQRLTDDERRLADRRARGLPWQEIAAELGANPEALRKQLERATERVVRELGLGEVGDA
jgi:RNA polymerase sigma-70 factor (ECF subfamily)